MKKVGRPPNPFKNPVHGVDEVVGKDPMPHEIDDAIDTMQRAKEIQNNPKMMAHVHEATGKKIKSLKSLKSLAARKAAQGL